jgi:hypothetical protein
MAEINKSHIEAADLGPIMHLLNSLNILEPNKADAETLKRRQSKIGIFVEGYNDDPRELFEIPEVCLYFQNIHQLWPYGLYFLSPETQTLQLLVWCNVEPKPQSDEATGAALLVNKAKLREFMNSAAVPVCEIATLIGWSDQESLEFLKGIAALFIAKTPVPQPPESRDERRRQRHLAFISSQQAAFAEFARTSFQEEGRGAIIILPPEPGETGSRAIFVNQSGLLENNQTTALSRFVGRYDPLTEFVVQIYEPDQESSSNYIVKFPDPSDEAQLKGGLRQLQFSKSEFPRR